MAKLLGVDEREVQAALDTVWHPLHTHSPTHIHRHNHTHAHALSLSLSHTHKHTINLTHTHIRGVLPHVVWLYKTDKSGKFETRMQRFLSIPLNSVMKLEAAAIGELEGFRFASKDFRTIYVGFEDASDGKHVVKLMKQHCFPSSINRLFAFTNKQKFTVEDELNGWPLYSVREEYERACA